MSPDQVSRLLVDGDSNAGSQDSNNSFRASVHSVTQTLLSPTRGRMHLACMNKADDCADADLKSSMRGSLTTRRQFTRQKSRNTPQDSHRMIPRERGGPFQDFRADTPLSREALIRNGLTLLDLKRVSYQQCLEDSMGHEQAAQLRYKMLEDNRRSLIRRCCNKRNHLYSVEAGQTNVFDEDIQDVFLRFAHGKDAPVSISGTSGTFDAEQTLQSVLGRVTHVTEGFLDLPAWILCLEALGYLGDRGSAAARGDGENTSGTGEVMQDLYSLEEAQRLFCEVGSDVISFGFFRKLVWTVAKVHRQREVCTCLVLHNNVASLRLAVSL
jgi:hypothetical protein